MSVSEGSLRVILVREKHSMCPSSQDPPCRRDTTGPPVPSSVFIASGSHHTRTRTEPLEDPSLCAWSTVRRDSSPDSGTKERPLSCSGSGVRLQPGLKTNRLLFPHGSHYPLSHIVSHNTVSRFRRNREVGRRSVPPGGRP